jgi:hypothetical protein
MIKAMVTLGCVLAMGTPVLAGAERDAQTSTAVYGAAEDESVQDFVQTVQWGGRGGRMWTCVARGRGGRTFLGQSHNANVARRIALNRCWNRSSACTIRNCR